ncbi:MAG: 50S ribosomal protein L11 methyltransferase, partial [Eubacterium sp.]|nr:50S ribosomal protein L11 methyltransferase [Eubacterium sp.]
GFVIHDPADFEEFLQNKDMNWDYVDDGLMRLKNEPTYLTLYLADNAQGVETLAALKGVLAELKAKDSAFYGSLDLTLDRVKEEDWANNWKQYYKPFAVGERLAVKPSWEPLPAELRGRAILVIDPASSFGTGQHHTTRLVMEALEETLNEGDRLLDLGCGSGILAIAGMLLGAKEAVLVDIFENAASTAAENMRKNGFFDGQFRALCGNILEDELLRASILADGRFRVVTANIVADVIVAMSGHFGEFLTEDGTLIISGIITERLPEVRTALRINGFVELGHTEREDWNILILKKGSSR